MAHLLVSPKPMLSGSAGGDLVGCGALNVERPYYGFALEQVLERLVSSDWIEVYVGPKGN